jgi:hypothetical protein
MPRSTQVAAVRRTFVWCMDSTADQTIPSCTAFLLVALAMVAGHYLTDNTGHVRVR